MILNNEMFSYEKNGYSKQEVETFFAEMKKVGSETVRVHRTEKEKLKQELEDARKELNEYRKHPDLADRILKQTETKREEIIDASKECYRLELLKLLELYKEEVDTFVKIKEEVIKKYGSFDDVELENKLNADRFRNKVRELLNESLSIKIDDNHRSNNIENHYRDEQSRLSKKQLSFNETGAQKVGARLSEISTNGYSKLLSKYLTPHRTKEELLGVNNNGAWNMDYSASTYNKKPEIKTESIVASSSEKREPELKQESGFNLREALITKATLDEIMEGFDFYKNQ